MEKGNEENQKIALDEKKGAGRPEKNISGDQVRALAQIHCTQKEMATVLGCSVDTLQRRFKDEMEEGIEQGKTSLRRHLWKLVENGNLGATIFLAKNLLGYRDKFDIDHSNTDGTLTRKYDLSSLSPEMQNQLIESLKTQL